MTADVDVHLDERLRRRRREIGWTLDQLAEAIGVRFQQIQKYETGVNKMSAARLWAISEALRVPVSYFYAGLEEEPRGLIDPGPPPQALASFSVAERP
jgi:transcriptional regulator with XRE-family HTH domain